MFRVDPTSSVPVFQQIADEVKSAIARGALRADDAIPSVRQMAADTLINPNTVAKAYRDLEREGVIYTRKGLGLFVSPAAAKQCRADRRNGIAERLQQLIAEAARAGLSADEARKLVERAVRDSYK